MLYICKTQIDIQSSNPCPISTSQTSVPQIYVLFFKFSNWRPMTSLAYASNYVTPVRSGFWSNDGEATRPDSRCEGFLMTTKKKKKWS